MKKINFYGLLLMLALVTTLGFASCSSDDNDGGSNVLVGTWVEDPSYSTLENFVLEFKSDGTLIEKVYDNTQYLGEVRGTYTYDGKNKLVVRMSEETLTVEAYIDGNTIELYNPYNGEIVRLEKLK